MPVHPPRLPRLLPTFGLRPRPPGRVLAENTQFRAAAPAKPLQSNPHMMIRRSLVCPTVIGREPEITELRAALQSAIESSGDFLLLAGEPGIGKSRVAAEVRDFAITMGFEVLQGSAYEGDDSVPYAVLADLLESSPSLADERAAVVALMSSEPQASRHDAGAGPRRALFEGICDRLASASAARPLLLVFDDIQWADPTTLSFIRLLAPRVRSRPILIVAAAREEALEADTPVGALVREFDRRRAIRVLPLAPLASAAVRSMIETTLGRPLPDVEASRVVELAEGNPFLVEELLRESDSTEPAGLRLPSTLRDLVLRHIESLSPAARELARFAAVVGRRFGASLLLGASPGEQIAAFEELVDSRVVLPVDGLEGTFTFRHALVAQAIYEAISPGRRREFHEAAALALEAERHSASGAATIAFHWRQAGSTERAIEALHHAAESASAAYAFEEAEALYASLLDAMPPGDSAERGRALISHALAASPVGGIAVAMADLEAARAMARRIGNPPLEAEAERLIGRQLAIMGRGREAVEHLRRAVSLLEACSPDTSLAWVQASLGRVLVMEEDESEAIQWARKALAGADTAGDRAVRASALNTIGVCLQHLGDPVEGLRSIEQAIREAEASGSADEITRAHNNYIHGLIRGFATLDVLLPAVERGLAAIERCGFIAGAMHTRAAVARALVLMGRWDNAERLLDEVQAHPTDTMTLTTAESAIGRGLLCYYRGDWDGAMEAFTASLDASSASNSLDPSATATAYLARIQRLMRRPATARATLRPALQKALERRSAEHLSVLVRERVSELVEEGDTAAAEALLGVLDDGPGDPDRPDRLLAGAAGRGTLRAAAGDLEAALQCYEQAEEVATARDRPLLAVELLVEAGACLLRRRSAAERARGQALFDRARALIPDPDTGFLDRYLELSGLLHTFSPAMPAELRSLSAREREVLQQIGLGRTNRQIAESLVLSERTIERHVGSIYAKLGLRGRSAAIAMAANHGDRPGRGG